MMPSLAKNSEGKSKEGNGIGRRKEENPYGSLPPVDLRNISLCIRDLQVGKSRDHALSNRDFLSRRTLTIFSFNMIHVSLHFIIAISIPGCFHAVAMAIFAAMNIKRISVWVCQGTFSTGLFKKATLASLMILTIVTENINE